MGADGIPPKIPKKFVPALDNGARFLELFVPDLAYTYGVVQWPVFFVVVEAWHLELSLRLVGKGVASAGGKSGQSLKI